MSTPATVKTHREPLLHTVKHAERSGRQTVALRLAAGAPTPVAGGGRSSSTSPPPPAVTPGAGTSASRSSWVSPRVEIT